MAQYQVVLIVGHILLVLLREWLLAPGHLQGLVAILQTVSLQTIVVLLDLQTIFMVNLMDLVHVDLVCQIHRQVVDHLVMVYVDNPLVDLDPRGPQDHL